MSSSPRGSRHDPAGGQRLVVRSTREDDLASLLRLFREQFGEDLTAEAWRWKYRDLPGTAASVVSVSDGGEVVAHAGALGLEARWRGGEGRVWQLVDFMASSRGGSLRSAMVAAGRRLLADLPGVEDAPWIFGFPSVRHYRLGERVFGYGPLPAVPELAGPLPETPPASTGEVEVSDQCGDWIEATWAACGSFGVRRSAAFLNWRYHARPERYYRFYRLRQPAGVADGLAVFAFVGSLARAAELWLPPAGEWRQGMLQVAADLWGLGVERWSFWPPVGSCSSQLLASLGVEATGNAQFMGRCGRSGEAAHAAALGFHYSMGDYDAV